MKKCHRGHSIIDGESCGKCAEYFKTYYLLNKPTKEERELLKIANRDKRKIQNKQYRSRKNEQINKI
jgi:hypothetical protein